MAVMVVVVLVEKRRSAVQYLRCWKQRRVDIPAKYRACKCWVLRCGAWSSRVDVHAWLREGFLQQIGLLGLLGLRSWVAAAGDMSSVSRAFLGVSDERRRSRHV